MSGDKISKENAEGQFQQLLDHYDIDLSELDAKNQRAAIDKAHAKIVKSIMAAGLEIKTEPGFTIVQHCKSGSIITYRELDGKAKVAMGSREENDNHGKIYAMMGSLSNLGFNGIAEMKGADLAVVEALGLVFLLV